MTGKEHKAIATKTATDRHTDKAHHDTLNQEVERIANITLHDGVSVDEHNAEKLKVYAGQVRLDSCGISETDERRDEIALDIVYEALLYRKMRSAADGNGSILDRGSEFGAGFS